MSVVSPLRDTDRQEHSLLFLSMWEWSDTSCTGNLHGKSMLFI